MGMAFCWVCMESVREGGLIAHAETRHGATPVATTCECGVFRCRHDEAGVPFCVRCRSHHAPFIAGAFGGATSVDACPGITEDGEFAVGVFDPSNMVGA